MPASRRAMQAPLTIRGVGPSTPNPLTTVRKRAIVPTVTAAGGPKHMAKSHLKLVAPRTVNRTVMPERPANSELRTREHLTDREVEKLMEAARGNRWGHRDATMIL